MRQRNLGGLVTSAIGLGCMGLSQGYGRADDADSVRVIHRALDLGVTLLDTAMSYGEGHNERLIARALRGRARPRRWSPPSSASSATRAGCGLNGRPEHVRGFCEASLRRLGRDVIDLYFLHRVDPDVPVADTSGAIATLVAEGRVRHPGCLGHPGPLEDAAAVQPVSAVRFEWSLLSREPEDDVSRPPGGWASAFALQPLGRGLLTAALAGADIDASDFRRADPTFIARPWTATWVMSRFCVTWRPGRGSRRAARPGLAARPGPRRRPDPRQPPPGPGRGGRGRGSASLGPASLERLARTAPVRLGPGPPLVRCPGHDPAGQGGGGPAGGGPGSFG